ncbi:MAG: hypothetical protein ABJK28_09250 [Algibacter sp.]
MLEVQVSKQEAQLIKILNGAETEKDFYPENRNLKTIQTISEMKFFLNYLEDIYNHKGLESSSSKIIGLLEHGVLKFKKLNS